jgi:Domain of unknown function (DUF4349)
MTTSEGDPMEPPDITGLATLLHAERPEPDPGWAARLDERAAAGLPRVDARDGERPSGQRPSRLTGGWMAPAGALAALLLVVVVVTQAGDEGGSTNSATPGSAEAPAATTLAPDAQTGAMERGAAPSTTFRVNGTTPDRGGIAPGRENRKVERDVQLSLSAPPDDVRPVTDEVISITRSLDGIVASSQVSETPAGARASLVLSVPTRNVDAALDRMTDLADVDSLNESSVDITKPVVSAKDALRDAQARRRELLRALGNAGTGTEADALEAKLAKARRDIARAQAAYERITRRARLTDLAVTVASNPAAADHRTLGDWVDDAVGVLRTLAGVLMVAAAVLIPLGLIAALVALVVSRGRRRRRERALDG